MTTVNQSKPQICFITADTDPYGLASYSALFGVLQRWFSITIGRASELRAAAPCDLYVLLPGVSLPAGVSLDAHRLLCGWPAADLAQPVAYYTSYQLDLDQVSPNSTRYHLPLGYDASVYRPASKPAQQAPTVGWLAPVSATAEALRQQLMQSRPAVQHVIIGADLTPAERSAQLAAVDLVYVDTPTPGHPLLLEAMACGAFPIAPASAAAFEWIQNGVNGLIAGSQPAAVLAALQWSCDRIVFVRGIGQQNALHAAAELSWEKLATRWLKTLGSMYLALPKSSEELQRIREFNLGRELGEWHGRAELAGSMLNTIANGSPISIIDMGCGKQGVRRYLAPQIRYQGVDSVERGLDQIQMDIGQQLPDNHYDVAVFLGVFEYFEDIRGFLTWARSSRYLLFTYNDGSDLLRCQRQNWRNLLSIAEMEQTVQEMGGTILVKRDVSLNEYLYVVSFDGPPKYTLPRIPAYRKLGLLSAGVAGDNSGDALITAAIKRLLYGNELYEFPLLQALTAEQIAHINTLDYLIICGTNLYQTVFACPLDAATIKQITVPIIPLGIGSSAELGHLPAMRAQDAEVVRLLHQRCKVSSVRDPYTLQFLHSIGVTNARLTACPVLFHGLQEPVFRPAFKPALTFAVRARLLHCAPEYQQKEITTLRYFDHLFQPELFLQSPYDIDLITSQQLAPLERCAYQPQWDATAMQRCVLQSSATLGFRLHYAMLSLSHGRPALLVGSDTRSESFCQMMGVPHYDIDKYTDAQLLRDLMGDAAWVGNFTAAWRQLRVEMRDFFHEYGIRNSL